MVDLLLLDNTLGNPELLDTFESLIWTERFQAFGDFELNIRERNSLMTDLRVWKYLRLTTSDRLMMVEKVEINGQKDGENLIKITGKSFEAFLQTRSNQTVSTEPITLSQTAGETARYFVERYCVNPTTTALHNVIPKLSAPPYINLTDPVVEITQERGNIYKIVKDVCEGSELGFKITHDGDGNLTFRAYRGSDYSNPDRDDYQEYSPDGENLTNPTYMESIDSYYNNCRVIGFKDIVDVYTVGTPETVSGFDRRTLVLEARDIGADNDTSPRDVQLQALFYRGLQALYDPANRFTKLVDGEIPKSAWQSGYFDLGDTVMVKDYYGNRNQAIITEKIWSVNSAGANLYPTFQAIPEFK